MTLWQLLYTIASGVPIYAGFEEGRKANAVGSVVGFLLGLAIGAGWLFGLLALRKVYLSRRVTGKPSTLWMELEVSFLYFVVFISSFVSGSLAIYITRFVIHHVAG
jgi:hypothetical protein